MAALGAVGVNLSQVGVAAPPSARWAYGSGQITGTAQLDEVATSTRLDLYDERMMRRLSSVDSAADGAFAFYDLAPGRYVVVVNGRGAYRARTFYVDVT